MGVCIIGSLNLDIVCRVAELPRPGETVAGGRVERLAGGKGLNQAIAASRHGAAVAMRGAVGDDDAGRTLLAGLRREGVNVEAVVAIAGTDSGQAYIWVSAAGENMIVVAGGANAALATTQISGAAFDDQTVFLAQLETPVDAIRALFESPAARRGLTLLNAAPALAEGRGLFALSDIVVVNETELARYAGLAQAPALVDRIIDAARGLICRPGQLIVVTLGAAGVVAVGADQVHQAPGRPAQVVDTTGAGDCFCGVLAACLSEGARIEDALAVANTAAALSTQRPGASPSMPRRAETLGAL